MIVLKLIFESIRFAYNELKVNKLRTLLSLLGVSVGIFLIILVFTVVDGLEKNIKGSFNFLGSNVLNVNKFPYGLGGGEYPWWNYIKRPNPDYSDFEFLKENSNTAKSMALYAIKGGQVLKNGSNNSSNNFFCGVTYDYNQVFDIVIEDGRYFSLMESENGRSVALIGDNIANDLFPNENPVGKTINVNGLKFHVIGIFEKEGKSVVNFASRDDMCIVPYRAFERVYVAGARRGIGATIALKGMDDDTNLNELEGEIRGLMRRKRSLKPKDEDDFALNRTEALAKAIGGIFDFFSVVGWVIGGLSILVGGFGIANIMFVSVRERTNIIGIQKSLGAKNYFILLQFLFESIFLSLIGGLVGLLLVYFITFIDIGFDLSLSINNISIGLIVSIIVGTISGIIPSAVAARMDPVIAIRTLS